jgi:uncharacterized protein
MMISFNFYSAIFGGILIGIAVSILLLINGRIAGISGILANLISPHHSDQLWRVLFLMGLILSPLIYRIFLPLPELEIVSEPLRIIISGVLVGFGTRLGSGCTSGHGICGLASFSLRSIIATTIFTLVAMLVVYFLH